MCKLHYSMRFLRNVTLLLLMCACGLSTTAQTQITSFANESFSSSLPQGWSAYPVSTPTAPTWNPESGNIVASGKYSMHGYVPYNTGDTVVLETPFYDFSNYKYVQLTFNHICKVLPSDVCQVMYKEDGMGSYYTWKTIPYDAYKGKSSYRNTLVFDHSTYTEWQASDTFCLPKNGWWKEECFDLSDYAGFTKVKFRFIIRKGSYFGSFIAAGWYIDDFRLVASNDIIAPPVVAFNSTFNDTVYKNGPFVINAKVATRSTAKIVRPWLHYTVTTNGVGYEDSLQMSDRNGGDSLWSATIPQIPYESQLTYFINGRDVSGNSASAMAGFYVMIHPPKVRITTSFRNTMFLNGPYVVDATVATRTTSPIVRPYLRYTITTNGVKSTDSLLMNDRNGGDSLWTATVPQFPYGSHLILSINGCDSMGNRAADSVEFFIMVSPPEVKLSRFGDTVYTTGPFVINAKVATRTTAPIVHPVLYYAATYDKVTMLDSLLMTDRDGGDSLWTATIPQHVYGTTLRCYINGWDSMGNSATDTTKFFLKYAFAGTVVLNGRSHVYGDTVTNIAYCTFPFMLSGEDSNWVKELWLADMVNPDRSGGMLGGIAFLNLAYNYNVTHHDVEIYLKATQSYMMSANAAMIDPKNEGATLVYKGDVTSQLGWMTIKFDRVFILPPDHNLQWYVVDRSPANQCNPNLVYFVVNQVPYIGADYYGSYGCGLRYNNGNALVSTAKFLFAEPAGRADSNSVAMDAFIHPTAGVSAGTQTVQVSIKNKGLANLTSANIGWSVNGVVQKSIAWTGDLPCDFNQTVTLGSYTQRQSNFDTLVAWVNTPNNVYDSVYTDDTLTFIAYGCDSGLNGSFTVGKGKDFSTLNDALFILRTCGVSGDVELQMASGTYRERIDFSGINSIMNGYTLTLSSIAGVADSVVFQPADEGVVVSLHNLTHMRFLNLTFDASLSKSHVVQIGDNTNDVEFRKCRIIGSYIAATSDKYAAVYANQVNATDIRFIGNDILYGTYGICLSGNSRSYMQYYTFDSNRIEGAYYYSAYLSYMEKLSFTHNHVLGSRGDYSYFCGIMLYNSISSSIESNQVRTYGLHPYQYGIYAYYCDSNTYVVNNEVLLRGNKTDTRSFIYGISTHYSSGIKVLHNSVYLQESAGTGTWDYGIYTFLGNPAYANGTVIRNNVVVTTKENSCPFYLISAASASLADIDYNCWWSPKYIAYANGYCDLQGYQQVVPSAIHDVYHLPFFTDTSNSRQPLHCEIEYAINCQKDVRVPYDKEGMPRYGITTRGCYSIQSDSADAALDQILYWPAVSQTGDTLAPSVILRNAGFKPLNAVSIQWYVNEVSQGVLNWSGNMAQDDTTAILLGSYLSPTGENRLKVVIAGIGSLKDEQSRNDTITAGNWTCPGTLSGNFTVGDTGYFKSLEEALDVIGKCGLGGHVTLQLIPGTYDQHLVIGPLFGASANHLLTITSLTGDSNSVVLRSSQAGKAPIEVANGGYLEISHLTLNGLAPNIATKEKGYALHIADSSHHVEVHHCHLQVSHEPGYSISRDRYAVNINGVNIRDISLHHNRMVAHTGVYATGSIIYGVKRLHITDNIIDSLCGYGCYMISADSVVISDNLFRQHPQNNSNISGIYSSYTNVNILRNVMDMKKLDYGIYFAYSGDTATGYCHVFNNEIRAATHGNYGVYITYGMADVCHNSFYLNASYGTTTAGVYCGYNNSWLRVANNLIHMTSTKANGYPICLAYYNNTFQIAHNNYYNAYPNNPYIGFCGGLRATNLSEWKNACSQDSLSVSLAPNYYNSGRNLAVWDTTGLNCPVLPLVGDDLLRRQRDSLRTTIGAYECTFHPLDAAITALLQPATASVSVKAGSQPLKVVLLNVGSQTLTSLQIGYSHNGVTGTSYRWSGNLPHYGTDTLTIGSFLPVSGSNNLKIFCYAPNGSTDAQVENDTLTSTLYGCDSVLHGSYTVAGSNADFASLEEAFAMLKLCTTSGPVDLLLHNGIYNTVQANSLHFSEQAPVTIRSASGIADSVVLKGDTALVLNNVNWINFRDLSFEANSVGVQLDDTVTNTCFSHCSVKLTGTNGNTKGFNYYNDIPNVKYMDSVCFTGNSIENATYGFYFHIASGNTNRMLQGGGLRIDSNDIRNALYGIYNDSYARYNSITHNSILFDSDTDMVVYGMFLYYACADTISHNRVLIRSNSTNYGIYFYRHNYLSTIPALCCNNEIRVSGSGVKYGIYNSYPEGSCNIYHNSVYARSDDKNYSCGFYVNNNVNDKGNMKNNLFVCHTEGATGYALYHSGTITTAYGERDYNNYFRTGGASQVYLNGARNNLSDIRSADLQQDQHSLNMAVRWKDTSCSMLEAQNAKVMNCPALAEVKTDIAGSSRAAMTVMGCYGSNPDSNDAALISFINLEYITSSSAGTIWAVICNAGYKAIDSAAVTLWVDDVKQRTVIYRPIVPLAYLQSDTLSLGSCQPDNGPHTFTACVNMASDTNQWNDTIIRTRTVCSRALAGTFRIGSSAQADFTIDQLKDSLFARMEDCGVMGDITLAFESGVHYGSIDLSDIANFMGEYHLTLTSLAGHRDSACITSMFDNVVTIGSANKFITVENLTLSTYAATIHLDHGCREIDIRHNNLLTDTMDYYGYGIEVSGDVSDVRIIGNYMEGGIMAMVMYSSDSRNLVVDSNVLRCQLYMAVNISNTHFRSFSHNRISARIYYVYNEYYGLYFDGCLIDSIIGNTLDANTSVENYWTYGFIYVNPPTATYNTVMANNSIKARGQGAACYFEGVDRVHFLNNTFCQVCFVYAPTGFWFKGYAFQGSSYGDGGNVMKGNQFITDYGQEVLYLEKGNLSWENTFELDYNNYYILNPNPNQMGQPDIAYLGASCATLSDMQQLTGMDKHSVSVAPVFQNSRSLAVKSSLSLRMPKLSGINDDITGKERFFITTMGCYEADLDSIDAALRDFDNTLLSINSSPVKVKLQNAGMDTLTSVTINWSFNGVAQTAVNWTGSLAVGESDVVNLGNLTGVIGGNQITVWLTRPNGKTDANTGNDTIIYIDYLCNGQLAAGNYTIGGNQSDFASVEEAKIALYTCGIAGPVVMRIRAGKYDSLMLEGSIKGASDTSTVTFMADSGATVIFDGGSEHAGLIFSNCSHLIFKGLTFGNTIDGETGVRMVGGCRNVTIRDCDILASVTTYSTKAHAFDYNNRFGAQYPEEVRLIANRITGGYANIYLYRMSFADASLTAASMYIDSNILTEAYSCGVNASYSSSIRSLSYNIIRSRKEGIGVYYGLYSFSSSNYEKVEGNRICVNNSNTGYGMYLCENQNSPIYSSCAGEFINNEIRVSGLGDKYGIYFNGTYSNLQVHHNSILVFSGNKTAYGLWMVNNTNYVSQFTRNLLSVEGTPRYALYISGSKTYATRYYMIREWNNLYHDRDIAYIEGDVTDVTGLLMASVDNDSNTKSVEPIFKNDTVNLELVEYDSFACPRLSTVTRDINGNIRTEITAIGAYGTGMFDGVNLQLTEFLSPYNEKDVHCYEDSTPVKVVIRNTGFTNACFDSVPMRLDLDVKGAINFHWDTLFRTGTLRSAKADTLILTKIPVMVSGKYDITVCLTDTADYVSKDDTLTMCYNAFKVGLPYDVDFSTIPDEFLNVVKAGSIRWQVEQGIDNWMQLQPVYGTGRLCFAGKGHPGTFANAIFNGVDVQNCINPKLSFWYAHTAQSDILDLTVVLASTNGGASYTELGRIMVGDTFTGWRQYDIDLSRFSNNPCLSIIFQAISFGNTNQNIDRIRITADVDAALSLLPVDIGKMVACENDRVPLRVAVSNLSKMQVTLDNDTIRAEVTGATTQSFSYVYNKHLEGYEADTLTLGYMDMRVNGNYYVNIAMQSQDDNALNDTISDSTMYVFQDIALESIIGIDNQVFKMAGDSVWVSVLVKNNSNMPVDKFTVRMDLDGEEVVTDTVIHHLEAGDTVTFAMSRPFIVPFGSKEQPYYFLELAADINCDAVSDNNGLNVVGNINVPDSIDLRVVSIAQPTTDKGRSKVAPKVTVSNIGNTEVYTVMLHVEVIDTSAMVQETVSEYISLINVNDTVEYEFTLAYTVPNYNGQYTLRAYLDSHADEMNTANDTLSAKFGCKFNDDAVHDVSGMGWNLDQNIPNPARTSTVIPFNLPEDANVTLTVMSVSGQLLYSTEISATVGENRYELDVENLSAGIYYYTMEYKGQRLVRKLNVVK